MQSCLDRNYGRRLFCMRLVASSTACCRFTGSETLINASTEGLQKATENPVSDLVSVPLQNNTNFNIGPYNRTPNVLNIQPIIAIHLTNKWNLITRTILPMVWQQFPAGPGGQYGTGDLNPTFFIRWH